LGRFSTCGKNTTLVHNTFLWYARRRIFIDHDCFVELTVQQIVNITITSQPKRKVGNLCFTSSFSKLLSHPTSITSFPVVERGRGFMKCKSMTQQVRRQRKRRVQICLTLKMHEIDRQRWNREGRILKVNFFD
jgi:hypothetical protein